VAGTPAGKTVSLSVFRDKRATTLAAAIGQLKEEEVVVAEKGDLGLTVQEINPEIAESLGLSRAHGVVITAVEPDSPGDETGLQPGDIIREINRKPIRDLSDYRKTMASAAQSKSILFLVQREDNTIFLALRKEE
jgi:serine protease Do